MPEAKALQTTRYLNNEEIYNYIRGVEYIIMAAPAPECFSQTPIHFTIFLNTTDNLPPHIAVAVLEKFLKEHSISQPQNLLSQLMSVGFGIGNHDTHMPLLIIKPQDLVQIPHTTMFVMDFLADSNNFNEVKEHSLTGWTYKYN